MKETFTTLKNILFVFALVAFGNSYAQVTANFNYSNSCVGDAATFTDASTGSIISYEWTFQGGPSSSNSQNPLATWHSPGVYAVQLIVSDGQVQDTLIQNITIYPTPGTNVYMTGGLSCNGDMDTLKSNVYGGTPPYTFSWSPGGETTENIYVGAGSYSVFIVDANGCQAGGSSNVNEPSPIDIIMADTSMCEGESITIGANVVGGVPSYTYMWGPSFQTTQQIVVSPVTTTQYTLNVTDANGCSGDDTMTVYVDPSPFADNEFISTCEESGGMATFNLTMVEPGITGGADATVFWFEDEQLTSQISTPSTYLSGTDTVWVEVISNQNGCKNGSYVELVVKDSSSNVVQGVVNFQGSPTAGDGHVVLIRKNGNLPEDMTVAGMQLLDAMGEFHFTGVSQGTYIAKAMLDTNSYNVAPTYTGDVLGWNNALEYSIIATCDDTVSIGFEMIVLPDNNGQGTINGRLIEDDGLGNNKAPGDPLGDIDITVEQSPGGAIMDATVTDVNGYFSFSGLDAGDYIIYADMHGYSMALTGVMSFDGSGMNYDVTLCANDTLNEIDMCNLATGLASFENKINLNIVPNPANESLRIYGDFVNGEISVIDVQGKVLMNKLYQNGESLSVGELPIGIYTLVIETSEGVKHEKLVINR